MCLNRREIVNPYTNKRLWVSCGHCPSCLQLKAYKHTDRIEANQKPEFVTLFCTFTYANRSLPYFLPEEFRQTQCIRIYRDSDIRWVRNGTYKSPHNRGRYKMVRRIKFERTLLKEIFVDDPLYNPYKDYAFPLVRNCLQHRVSVVYLDDFSTFVKRLRINLQRKFHYAKPFSYVYCSEYGPKTKRAHFHALFTIPCGDVSLFKNAIASSWSFDDFAQCKRNISIAKDAASYVSSYVNCHSYIPGLFSQIPEIRPSFHMSQGYGLSKRDFTFLEVCKKIESGNLRYDVPKIIGKSLVVVPQLVPKYVINRYFPKFKGYRYLNVDEVFDVFEKPSRLWRFARKCELNNDECQHIVNFLYRKLQYAFDHGLSAQDYALLAKRVHTVYFSNVMEDFYAEQARFFPYQISEFYDNITAKYQWYRQPYFTLYIDGLFKLYPQMYILKSPNDSAIQAARDAVLVDAFNKYDKSRKIRNFVYSQISNFNV